MGIYRVELLRRLEGSEHILSVASLDEFARPMVCFVSSGPNAFYQFLNMLARVACYDARGYSMPDVIEGDRLYELKTASKRIPGVDFGMGAAILAANEFANLTALADIPNHRKCERAWFKKKKGRS